MQNDNEKFSIIEFPDWKKVSVVYIIFFIKQDKEIPFYVGETGVLSRRLGEYVSANFQCPADFKVGEAINYFQEEGCRIIVKYKMTDDRKKEENDIIREFQGKGLKLLNELIGYKPSQTNKEEELKRVRQFCKIILEQKMNSI